MILMIVALVATSRIAHVSIATGGMGMVFPVYAIPVLSLAFVVWAVACRHFSDRPRRAAMVVTILIACGVWTLVRTGGFTSDFDHDFAWRWASTPEERLLARDGGEPMALPSAPAAVQSGADWPGFRGPDRDGIRESNAGAGPRATPTLNDGRVYTFGATGILDVLDAGDGALVWAGNAASGTDTTTPHWGFSNSPLVVDDVVIVIAAAAGRLAAYNLATGDPRWIGPDGGDGYSSPHLLTIDGIAQIMLSSRADATSVAPAWPTLLWEHPWPGGARIVQPALTAEGDILISRGENTSMRRIAVARGPDGWTIEARWTSARLEPHFSDFVVHDGHAFGFDGSILACIDVEDGKRKWKGGRYGSGQLVLLADQNLLLVLSETGGLALVATTPDQFTQLARFPAIEGKTWNHPVLVGDVLLVRNAQEMAAFRLSLAGDGR